MKKLLSRVIASAVAVIIAATPALAIEKAAQRSVSPKAVAEAQQQGRRLPATMKQRELRTNQFLSSVKKLQVKKQPIGLRMAPANAPAAASTIYGNVIYSTNSYYGMSEVDVQTLQVSALEDAPKVILNGGAAMADNIYVGTYIETFWGYIMAVTNYVYNAETWEVEVINENPMDDLSCVAFDMACDPESGDIYGVFYDADLEGVHFGVLDIDEWVSSDLGEVDMEDPLYSIAFDSEGTLYGITASGVFGTVDKATGELTVIADTGVSSDYQGGAVIDSEIGVFYYTPSDDWSSQLYAIDVATGNAEYLGDFENSEQVVGLYIPGPAAADGAPAVPTDVVVVIDDDLNGTVTFDAPDTTYGGEALSGTITYNIYDGDSKIATGTCEAGTVVEAAVKLDKKGPYAIRVSCQNEAGEGPKCKQVKGFAGSIEPPYENDFGDLSSLAGYTIVDANADGITWGANDGALSITYNREEDMDDYVVTPPFYFEAGKAYDFVATVYGEGAYYPEAVEFLLVQGTSLDAMAAGTVFIPETVVDWDMLTATPLESAIVVPTSGKYNIAIHGISEANQYNLYVDDISISAPYSSAAPALVENVKFIPATNGDPVTNIQFDAPAKAVNGEALTEQVTIKVTLDGEEIATKEVAAGAAVEVECKAPEAGTYTIAIQASNAAGAGKTYKATMWIGVDYAAAPEDVTVNEWYSTPGKVTISWTGVAEDCNGNAIDASLITYNVYNDASELIAEGIACQDECEYTYDAVPAGEQEFVYYYVVPVTERGENRADYGTTDMIACGTPYDMPMVEAFDDVLEYILMVERVEGYGTSWSISAVVNGITPVDGDNGMLNWWPYAGEVQKIISGKVNVAEAETVAYTFFYHTTTTDEGYEVTPIIRQAGFDYVLEDYTVATAADVSEWREVIVPLVDYVGTTIQVGFQATCIGEYDHLLIDQFGAQELAPIDLAAISITAPKGLEVGQKGTIVAEVGNRGLNEAAGSVQFYCNGQKYGEAIAVESLTSGKSALVSTEIEFDVFADPDNTFYFEVECAEDGNLANNISNNAVVRVSQPMVPAVEDLEGSLRGNTAVLTWTSTDTPSEIAEIVDDVENYDSFAINQAGDWTFVDGDGSSNYGFNGISFPNSGQPAAFIVFDVTAVGEDELPDFTYSGNKVFACFAAADGPNDDWMISPTLPGVAQTLSFMARAWTISYGMEEFEVYYSTEGADIDSMVLLSDGSIEQGEEWTEYTFDLPEGTTNFAIRCVSNDRFIFLVDDITFTTNTEAFTVDHYNVYMNGELIGTTTDTTYETEVPSDEDCEFYVTAVYVEQGESALSNPVILNTSGIADAAKALRIRVEGRQIIIENAQSVLISAADGKVVASAKGEARVNATVAPGVYVVKTNIRTAKVIVK